MARSSEYFYGIHAAKSKTRQGMALWFVELDAKREFNQMMGNEAFKGQENRRRFWITTILNRLRWDDCDGCESRSL